jgi:hypothetical protein
MPDVLTMDGGLADGYGLEWVTIADKTLIATAVLWRQLVSPT